jgi:hypothetical protein
MAAPALPALGLFPPSGYSVSRVSIDDFGIEFFRAIRVVGAPGWQGPLRATYSAAETDAHLHSVGGRS